MQTVTLNNGGYTLYDDEMARITELDTGASVFFDHRTEAIAEQSTASARPHPPPPD
jgi:hypothetical protein